MSATLIWQNSGIGTKTGTTAATLMTDMTTLMNSKLADSVFLWQVASSSIAGPAYLVAKRKDGSPGRILLIVWLTLPAGNNTAILDVAPSAQWLYCAYFPNGNVDTPSNLTAASGTIMGDDTGVVKVCMGMNIASIYAAGQPPFYFESAEAVLFGTGSTGMYAGGNLIIDAADNVYPATLSLQPPNFGGPSTGPMDWTTAANGAGTANAAHVRTNYGSNNRVYYGAWKPSGTWVNISIGSADILTDTSNNKVWFVPYQLVGMVKGEGFVLKLRQFAFGPATTTPFVAYQTTGPVVQARCFCSSGVGGTSFPWITNFKL